MKLLFPELDAGEGGHERARVTCYPFEMNAIELRSALSEILSEEEGAVTDWDRVQDLSLALLGKLQTDGAFEFPIEIVIPYLTDFSLRRADAQEALRQQDRLIGFLRSGGEA